MPSHGEGWQNLRLELADIDTHFNGQLQNIGVLLGAPWNLTDVDLDCRESLAAWREFEIETGFCFGRRSKPASHFFYYLDQAIRSVRFQDPILSAQGGEGGADKACLLELRCMTSSGEPGLQTVCPPSIHPSGERIEFAGGIMLDPATTEAEQAMRAAELTAAACLLGRYAPGDGARHDYFLNLSGALAHGKWPIAEATALVRAIYRILWGEKADLAKAAREVESTFQRYDDGHEITGLPHLKGILDPRIFAQALKWLGLEQEKKRAPFNVRKPKPLPTVARLEELTNKTIVMPDQSIQNLLVKPGVTLLVGPPKSGKTVLGVQMIMSLASGKPLFDWFSLQQTPTLIVEQDDQQGEASLKDFRLVARAYSENSNCHYVTDTDFLIDQRFLGWLENQITQFSLGVVLLDSYSSLRGFRSGNVDIVKAEAGDFGQLGELARKTGAAIIVIHHSSKTSTSKNMEWTDRAAGSYAVAASTDTQIFITRFADAAEHDGARLVRVRGRKLRGTEFVLRFREQSLDYDLVMEGSASIYYPEIRLLAGAFSGRAFTAKDVTGETGWARATTYKYLSRLTTAAILNKSGNTWSWREEIR